MSVALTKTKEVPTETEEGVLPSNEVEVKSTWIGIVEDVVLLPTPNCPTVFEPQVL